MISSKSNNGINGTPIIPGDKSISHRSIIIPSISNGICEIENLLNSDDVNHTVKALKDMGVKIEKFQNKTIIYGKGLNSLKQPNHEIYLGNSGTSARLLMGLLSSQNFNTVLTGDKSLSSRPMERITNPLKQMEAEFDINNGILPIKILGKKLAGAEIEIKIPSAQIKSGLLLASLNACGTTIIKENRITRNHTEIMLKSFDADISLNKVDNRSIIIVNGQKELKSKNISVPSDLSSSSFFIVACLINKNSKINLEKININSTRNGILIALKKMGANILYKNIRKINNEEICDMEIESSNLNGCILEESMADLMIDEYPILAVAAAFARSPSVFKGLRELKVKESNRLELIEKNLTKCGVKCEVKEDDLYIYPSNNYQIKDENIETGFDHRIAMAFSVMGSIIGPLKINDSESINTSFPNFINIFNEHGGNLY